MSTTCAPSICCSLLAIARPTAPAPITACVKSARYDAEEEKQRTPRARLVATRLDNITAIQRRRDRHENATDNNVLDESAGGDAHGRRMIDNKLDLTS